MPGRNTGLLFKVKYGGGKAHEISFGAEAALTEADTVSFRLNTGPEKRDLGVNVELSRRILKGSGEAFIRALKSTRESALYAGAAWRW